MSCLEGVTCLPATHRGAAAPALSSLMGAPCSLPLQFPRDWVGGRGKGEMPIATSGQYQPSVPVPPSPYSATKTLGLSSPLPKSHLRALISNGLF